MTPLAWNLTEQLPMLSVTWGDMGMLAVVLLLAVIIAFLVATFVPVFQIAGYVHAVTYAHTKGMRFVRTEEILGLLEIRDPEELASTLRAHGVEEIGFPMSAEQVQDALRAWHARELDALLLISPAGIRPFLETLQLQFEIEALKGAILRKHSRRESAEILAEVRPFGSVDRRMLQRMAEAPGIEGLIEVLSPTPYGRVLEEAFQAYSARWEVTALLFALERFLHRELCNAVSRCDRLIEAPLLMFLETKTDLRNIAVALSAKMNGISAEGAASMLIPEGGSLSRNLLERMIGASTLAEALMLLKETPYMTIGERIPQEWEAAEDLPAVLHALDEYWLDFAFVLGSRFPLTAGPLLQHLIGLETARRNLQILFTGAIQGYGRERMGRLILMRGVPS